VRTRPWRCLSKPFDDTVIPAKASAEEPGTPDE
jgi:hypothetical protein